MVNDQLLELENVTFIGDFNLWIEDENNLYGKKFKQDLDIFNMSNVVTEPTSRGSHILDFIITSNTTDLVKRVEIEPNVDLSDHKLITFYLDVPRKQRTKTEFSFRSKRSFNASEFMKPALMNSNAAFSYTAIVIPV